MDTKQTEYIRANHIDTISPSNGYNAQQKRTLNYIIQVLLNNDTERLDRWQSYTRYRKGEIREDLALTLVLAGTSMKDQDIVNWVYNNGHANSMTTLKQHHMRHLNQWGFNIEWSSIIQVNSPIYDAYFSGPYSDDDSDDDSDSDADSDDDSDSDADSDDDSDSDNVYVGIYVYKSEEDAKAHRNPLSRTITKVPNDDNSDDLRGSNFVPTERYVHHHH